jgi:hypothetical protein
MSSMPTTIKGPQDEQFQYHPILNHTENQGNGITKHIWSWNSSMFGQNMLVKYGQIIFQPYACFRGDFLKPSVSEVSRYRRGLRTPTIERYRFLLRIFKRFVLDMIYSW